MFITTQQIAERKRAAAHTANADWIGFPVELATLLEDGGVEYVPAFVLDIKRFSQDLTQPFRVDLALPTIRERIWVRQDDLVVSEISSDLLPFDSPVCLARADECAVIQAALVAEQAYQTRTQVSAAGGLRLVQATQQS